MMSSFQKLNYEDLQKKTMPSWTCFRKSVKKFCT